MPRYCVHKEAQSNGDHEVHNLDASCQFTPHYTNRIDLGSFPSCSGAVAAAKLHYSQSNGCVFCATACHTS